MNKKKIIARIVAAVLVLILIVGLIAPVVSATEIEATVPLTEPPEATTSATEPEVTPPATEAEPVVSETQADEKRKTTIPNGFIYVTDGGITYIDKAQDNKKPAAILDGIPKDFDTSTVTIFIGNIETQECTYYNLTYGYTYVTSFNLPEGYYVIFDNGFAWSDANGNAYSIEDQYFYVGDNYDDNLYDEEFTQDENLIRLNLRPAVDGAQIVKYNSSVLVNSASIKFPDSARLQKKQENSSPEVSKPTETENPEVENEEPQATEADPNEKERERKSVLAILWGGIKKSAVLLIAIAACFAGSTYLRIKREKKLLKQTDDDKYDDQMIE